MPIKISMLTTSAVVSLSVFITLQGMHKQFIQAVCANNSPVIRYFLGESFSINGQNNSGDTALMWAAFNNNKELVVTLLQRNARVDIQDSEGDTAVMWAAMRGCTDIVELLLQAGAQLDIQNVRGQTALICAVLNGHTDTVQHIIAGGPELELHDRFGNTALACAARSHFRKIAQLLIASGAHVPSSLYDYNLYAHYADTITLLFMLVKTPFTIPQAQANERTRIHNFNRLITCEIPLDLADAQGNTVLHYAVLNNNRVLTALILYLAHKYALPALINHKNKAGQTPLDIAVLKAPEWLLPVFFKVTDR